MSQSLLDFCLVEDDEQESPWFFFLVGQNGMIRLFSRLVGGKAPRYAGSFCLVEGKAPRSPFFILNKKQRARVSLLFP
jgi:hypothetical protein